MLIKVKIITNENVKYFGCEHGDIREMELEDYVRCVVAGEMGNAPDEALRAQAIASRTYACAQGVLDGKIISDSAAKAQAFRAPRCNYKRCNQATKDTEGMVLTYGGKYASTYFCHSNGGQCKSSEEVWGGKRPYLVSRKDPWTIEKRNGHCVGMSQVGAIAAAKQGIGYRDILSFYYPKTTLKKIESNQDTIGIVKAAVEEAIKKVEEML